MDIPPPDQRLSKKVLEFSRLMTDTDYMNTNKHHETKTFQGRKACAGSGTPYPVSTGNAKCPVCGRSGFSTTATQKVGTHIHADDVARTTKTSAPAPAPKPITPQTMTTEQHEAIKAFHADENAETYAAMKATGADNEHRYAREQGWTK